MGKGKARKAKVFSLFANWRRNFGFSVRFQGSPPIFASTRTEFRFDAVGFVA